jgi:hypothetical protein
MKQKTMTTEPINEGDETIKWHPKKMCSDELIDVTNRTKWDDNGVTGCGVTKHPPSSDHKVSGSDSDLLLKGLSN